jgi:two-component system phosphate regulon sensor histidine kinase PhoR
MFSLNKKNHEGKNVQTLFNQIDFQAYIHTGDRQPLNVVYPPFNLSLSIADYNDGYLLLAKDVTHVHHLERIRQDFVANVSHELRTPLTVIHGYLELLLQQNLNADAAQKIFGQMHLQTLRMEKLVSDLLLLARLENEFTETDKFSLVNVPAILKRICDDARALSGKQKHKIHLNADLNLKIYGLENELTSAFSNIIFNAVNYTPSEGEIWVNWYQDQHQAYLEVKDSGIGISAEHIPRLTERFYRVDKARSRDSGGTGLGLAIVKHVLLLHKANLQITSEVGKGSVFTCCFSLK